MAQSIKNLPIGAKVYFGKHSVNGEYAEPIVWLIVDRNHYGNNEVTLLTEKVIDFRAYDAGEPNNPVPSRDYGNNRYDVSNIHQWLNSEAGANEWYLPQHSVDQSPDAYDLVTSGTEYTRRPGFLNNFTADEKRLMVKVPIISNLPTVDGGSSVTIYPKMFLPSVCEIDNLVTGVTNEGTMWTYFNNMTYSQRAVARLGNVTTQAMRESLNTNKPTSQFVSKWWTRTPDIASNTNVYTSNTNDTISAVTNAKSGMTGIRPATNLSDTIMVSDTTDSNGVYNIVEVPPEAPTGLRVISTGYGADIFVDTETYIAWDKAPTTSTPIAYYELQVKTPAREFYVIDTPAVDSVAKGTGITPSTSVILPPGEVNEGDEVSFRIRAIGANGLASDYSETVTQIAKEYFFLPVILKVDTAQIAGVKTEGFSFTYSVGIPEGAYNIKGLDVRISITTNDGSVVLLDEYTHPIEEMVAFEIERTCNLVGEDWLKLANGIHKLYLRVKPVPINNGSTMHTTQTDTSFIKQVDTLVVGNADAIPSTSKPYRISTHLIYGKPLSAILKVEVCNNGFDENPTWEDMTYAVQSGSAHIFTNTTKTADKWGVKIRASINRNGSVGECYISSIGGNWE